MWILNYKVNYGVFLKILIFIHLKDVYFNFLKIKILIKVILMSFICLIAF